MNPLAGTTRIARLVLRRDRVVMPIWVTLLGLLPALGASSMQSLYPTAAARAEFAAGVAGNPAELALIGPVFDSSVGGLTAWRNGTWFLLAAIAGILTIVRHTRTEEASGRRELLCATAVGRHAPLAAALLVTAAGFTVVGVLATAALTGLGLPPAGSAALGFGMTAAGWMFAAVAALTAQLVTNPGTARGLALLVLGGSYLLRAMADPSGSWLSWLSPLAWVQRVRPFAEERWWVFALALGLVAALVAAAAAVAARRDLGAGLLPARSGPEAASARLRSPLALAWRLHRGLLLGVMLGFALVGAAFGGMAQSVSDQLAGSAQLRALVAALGSDGTPVDGAFALVMYVLGIGCAAYALVATLRLRTEETSGRADAVLATAVGRLRWVGSHLLLALAGPVAVLGSAGLTMGLVYGLGTGAVGAELVRLLGAALVYVPAVWVTTGVAVALYGLLPRAAAFGSWAALAVFLLMLTLAQLGAPEWVLHISPFLDVPNVPAVELRVAPLLWLTVVAAALLAAGLAGARRRDLS